MGKVNEADPRLDRQLFDDGPMFLWRDGPGGARQGLLLAVRVCPWPGCPDRHVAVEGYWVDPALRSAGVLPEAVGTYHAPGAAAPPRHAFDATVGVDGGEVEAPRPFDPGALAWLERELDGPLLAALQDRFARGRRAADAGPNPFLPAGLRAGPRVGRNDPCPCGSGRKFKRCCLRGGPPGAAGLREVMVRLPRA